MKRIDDLIFWLDKYNFPDGLNDIRKMQSDHDYACKVGFETDVTHDSLVSLLIKLFDWDESILGEDYYEDIFERLCIFEEIN
jgi:hypothetical protein